MKSLLNKVLVFVIVASVAISVFSCVAFANPEEVEVQDSATGAVTEPGTTEDESGEESQLPKAEAFNSDVKSDFDYKAYVNSISDTTQPDVSIKLEAKDAVEFDRNTGEIIGSLPIVEKASEHLPDTLRKGAVFYDEGICGWVFNVEQSGWYNITFSYLLYEKLVYEKDGQQVSAGDKSSPAQRRVYIDYKLPFYDARQVNFERVWKDNGVLTLDSQTNNEKRPYQSETEQWQTVSLRDYMGYEIEPFKFYFEKGQHVLAFEAIKEGMVVEYAELHQLEAAKPYAEVKKEYEANGYKPVNGDVALYIQAEGLHAPDAYNDKQGTLFANADAYNSYISPVDTTAYDATKDVTFNILKSSPTLYAITDRSSPSTVPYHHSKIRYNTIGADKWQAPNDWIEWTFEVEKAGLYAISLKARQNTLSGLSTTRKLTVNGEVPCQEVNNLTFEYGNSFTMYTPHTADGETILFYFNEGKNTIRLETTLGDMGDFLAATENSLSQLNYAYRRILMITGASPDVNKSYMLDKMSPDALKIILTEYRNLTLVKANMIKRYGEGIRAQLTSLESMTLLFERMIDNTTVNALATEIKKEYGADGLKDLDKMIAFLDEKGDHKLYENTVKMDHTVVPTLFTNFKDSIASMGTWINDMSQNPLELDYIVITSEDTIKANSMPNPDAGFFAKMLHEVRSFIASFTEDYDNIGGTVAQDGQEPVIVWLETGAGLTGSRDNATILKQLIDDMFTAETGIIVSTRLVAGGSLLPSVLAGIGPELCLSRGAVDAVNYAFRGAVMNLANEELFPDYKDILLNRERYAASAVDPFTFGNGIYAVPETQDFFMTFYRTDILEELGLEPPETWDEVYNIIGHLQNQQMTFAMPVPVVGAVGSGNNTFATLLYQKGGQYYTEDRDSTDLNSDAALDAFKEWTEFYTLYDLPNTYDFANRFRTGEVPVGIASYSQYSQLAVFAPEIQGLWEFSLVPGTVQKDENGNVIYDENGEAVVDHSCASTTSGCVMLSIDSSTEEGKNRIERAWEFMKWWTGEDAQYRFGTEIESLLGAAARYQTANLQAMARLPWDKTSMTMIQEQWKYCKAIPQVPGGYYTARNIEFAWKEVINNAGADPNTTFVEYVSKIDREIDRKREEFKHKIEQMTGKAVE